jgi:peptidoglycan-associated lipoprotein
MSSNAPSSSPRGAAMASGAQTSPDARSVYYEFDKSDIKADGLKVIEANAQYLRDHPATKVRIEGNADERGSAEYNLALGQRRAESVQKRMTLLGIQQDRIETVSYGKEKPKAKGHDESAWSQNRRSDIVYQ